MPELPEVETIANGLQKRVAGDVIESVWLSGRAQVLKSPAQEIAAMLEGARIRLVRRVGKHIAIDLAESEPHSGEYLLRGQWIVHLGMTGRIIIAEPQAELVKHTHLIATLASGKELRYVDPRMFGKLQVVAAGGFEAPGAEPIGADREEFRRLFHRRKTPIKSALLNQKLLSGIGNIYADESLFRAGIRPRRRAASLTRADLLRLYDAIQQVLAEAIAAGGSSISDYVDATGDAGSFQFQHRVYQRENKPCLVCGTPIKRFVIAGRSSHYCPRCQR
ncbi:MAG TPA: bifunctional DNA-formamidopyrimidine glycosylase/DNA-(apurinic or apyrimidinic site) lyase [Clostridia bacterium]|nr:bifunctional DNA-formamidopyrimidine glycosylase/DNA-(apurinic or apyrimidinic site) lyase [Clostridia bacterium]